MAPRGMPGLPTLQKLVDAGEIDTVLAVFPVFPDMQGRPAGRIFALSKARYYTKVRGQFSLRLYRGKSSWPASSNCITTGAAPSATG